MTTHEKQKRKNFCHYTTTWEISAIWLAESRCISAQFETPTCKNYSYYGNPKSPNNVAARITQKWRIDFENQENQELKENSENQNTEKSTSTWLNVWTSWVENKNFETNLFAYEAKQLEENKQLALDDWISQVVV